MFESLALEDQRTEYRRWSTFASFTIETAFVLLLVVLPLTFPEVLPTLRIGDNLIAPVYTAPQPEVTQLVETRPATTLNRSEIIDNRLISPSKIPDKVAAIVDKAPLVPPGEDGVFIPGAIPGPSTSNPLMRNLLNDLKPAAVAQPSIATKERVRISHLDPGMLIRRIEPTYPQIAIATRIQGTVTLAAVIDTQGRITQLRALSGHPMLIPAAIDAVRQWRYRPYLLNGSPTEVETQVSVIFSMR